MSTLRGDFAVEHFNRRGAGMFPGFVGLETVKIEDRLVRMRLALRSEHIAPNGFLHGAVVVTLADTACGYGTLAHLPDGASGFTTVELKTNFLGTVREGAIVCDATPLHMGRSTHVWDAEVLNERDGDRLAMFRCTQMILWPRR